MNWWQVLKNIAAVAPDIAILIKSIIRYWKEHERQQAFKSTKRCIKTVFKTGDTLGAIAALNGVVCEPKNNDKTTSSGG